MGKETEIDRAIKGLGIKVEKETTSLSDEIVTIKEFRPDTYITLHGGWVEANKLREAVRKMEKVLMTTESTSFALHKLIEIFGKGLT